LVVGLLGWWASHDGGAPDDPAPPGGRDALSAAPATDDRPFAERRPAPVSSPNAGADSGAPSPDTELQELLQEFADTVGGLACRLSVEPDNAFFTLTRDDGTQEVVGAIIGPMLFVADPSGGLAGGSRGGRLEVQGFDAVDITWSPAGDGTLRCDDDPVQITPLSSGVVGYVSGADGLPEGQVWVTGCGSTAFTDEEGAFFLPARPGPCAVQGVRQDGYWRSRTDRVELTVPRGHDAAVDLVLPDRPRGGVGVSIRATPHGVVMPQVHEGGSAWEAGLRPGSLVIAIEGDEGYDPWDLDRFIDTVTGPTGTDVELTVQDPDGDVRTVVLDRREMGPNG
jgi:hypothetical protein